VGSDASGQLSHHGTGAVYLEGDDTAGKAIINGRFNKRIKILKNKDMQLSK